MASPASSSRRQQQSTPLSSSALRARNALVLEHLSLADALASAAARRLFPLVEREDLIQVAREALVRSAPRCRAGELRVVQLRPSPLVMIRLPLPLVATATNSLLPARGGGWPEGWGVNGAPGSPARCRSAPRS